MSPDIEWHIGDETGEETIRHTTPRPPRWRKWIMLAVVALGVGLGIAYGSIPGPPRPTPLPPTAISKAIPAKLYETLDREAQALADGDLQTYLELHVYEGDYWTQQISNTFQAWEHPTDRSSLYSIIDFKLRTPRTAWVDIRQFRNGHSFRETRFYIWDGDRWLRNNPDLLFWNGESETLDTLHLHVIYAVEDRELVQIAAEQMEELYTSICASLNCAEVTPPFTYTVNMNNYQQVDNISVGHIGEDGQTLSLLSPRVAGVYEGTRPPYLQSDNLPYFMGQTIAQRIAYGRLMDTAYGSSTAPAGVIMIITIGNWAGSRVNNQAATVDLQVNSIKSKLQPPLRLESLWGPVSDGNWQEVYDEAFAAVYFIEQQYGEAAVPNVLKNLGQAQSFADLIEKSLGVSFAEFDQKWQEWMTQ